MKRAEMTPLERVLTTLAHKEPDRVPFFLLPTMHGAKELGLSIKDYFSKAEHVVEGQLRLLEKYRHDCLSGFFYGAVETEAWGGEVLYRDDGPPNSGAPIISSPSMISKLHPPSVEDTPCLVKVLDAIRGLKEHGGQEIPIIGVVISPFSLPVMQMGFDRYLDLMYEDRKGFDKLMSVNEEFCVSWAKAQLAAGATAICYFDPVASTTIIPRDLYLKTGHPVAVRTIARIDGPVAYHLASGRGSDSIDDIARAGAAVLGISCMDDITKVKAAARGKITLLGNLNGIAMRRWTRQDAEKAVKEAIAGAGPGGGFILSDNHGEIPYQVPDDVLSCLSESVRTWGTYPLTWVDACE